MCPSTFTPGSQQGISRKTDFHLGNVHFTAHGDRHNEVPRARGRHLTNLGAYRGKQSIEAGRLDYCLELVGAAGHHEYKIQADRITPM